MTSSTTASLRRQRRALADYFDIFGLAFSFDHTHTFSSYVAAHFTTDDAAGYHHGQPLIPSAPRRLGLHSPHAASVAKPCIPHGQLQSALAAYQIKGQRRRRSPFALMVIMTRFFSATATTAVERAIVLLS